VVLRRIEVDLHAVVYNETQSKIDRYEQRHGEKYLEAIMIPIVDMGEEEFVPSKDARAESRENAGGTTTESGTESSAESELRSISKEELTHRVLMRAKAALKSLVSTPDMAKIVGAIARHKIQIRARSRARSQGVML
jgi:hypothetical protein